MATESEDNWQAAPEPANPASPWQAFQAYLLEKIASVRHFSLAGRRPEREEAPEPAEEERALAEAAYLYGAHDPRACPALRLPQELLLAIFSRLEVRDLLAVAQVCRLWRKVSEDPLMWSARLTEDARRWPFISSHTFIDKELSASAPAKRAYLRCAPDFGGASASPGPLRRRAAAADVTAHVSSLWRSWFPRKNPRFLLSEGDPRLKFMRRVLHDKFDAFVPVSMFSTEWFLSTGLTYQMRADGSDLLFDLVTFGNNPRVEQRLFETAPGTGEAGAPRLRLGDDFARYVHLIDGLVFVMNAESGEEEFRRRRAEYRAFVDTLADRPSVPVLFLSLVLTDEARRQFSCVEMARKLGLIALPNPWIICDGRCDGLQRVFDGFLWLMQRAA